MVDTLGSPFPFSHLRFAITKRVLEEEKKTKRKTPEEAGDVANDDEEEEDCPSAHDKRARLSMNNNKIEKESEPGEFTNHEDEVRECVGVGPHLDALPPATVSEPHRDPRPSRQEKRKIKILAFKIIK